MEYPSGQTGVTGKIGKNSKMKGGNLTGIVAAMMPGAKVDRKGKVSVDIAVSMETVVFNIGGTMFETYRSTLTRMPNSPLANDRFLKSHYRPEKDDYFFDRDPDIFRATLNYLRTGELHLPSYVCGPAAKCELDYWGLLPNKIERCCWTNYHDWNSTLEALEQLEHDRKGSMLSDKERDDRQPQTRWNIWQPRIWSFLNIPDSSFAAKIFGIASLVLVLLSIFSFVAETTEYFSRYGILTRPSGGTNASANYSATYEENVTPSTVTVKLKHPALRKIDIICLLLFSVEYILKIIFSPRKLKFITSPMGVIDVLAILPDYIEMIVYVAKPELVISASGVNFIEIMRIMRVLRIFRLIRHVPGLWILVYTLKASVGELVLLTCFMSVGILIFSSLIYFVEERDNFPTIPHGFWWAIITMTTVGYGDISPVTVLGKIVGSICAMCGLLMIGFSVPALVNNFMLYYKHIRFALQAERDGTGHADDGGYRTSQSSDFDNPPFTEIPKNVVTSCGDRNQNDKAETVPLVPVV